MTPTSHNAEDTCLKNQIPAAARSVEDLGGPAFRASEVFYASGVPVTPGFGFGGRETQYTFTADGDGTTDQRKDDTADRDEDARSSLSTITPILTAPPPSVMTHDGGLHGVVSRTDSYPNIPRPTNPLRTIVDRASPSSGLESVGLSKPTPSSGTTTDSGARPPLLRSGTARQYLTLAQSKLTAAGEKLGSQLTKLASGPASFPEGGLRAWLAVFGSFSGMACVYGVINSAAVFESWFSSHQLAGYPPSTIGWIFSLYLFVVFFVGLQVGPIFDAYGPRIVVLLGTTLIAASMLLLGQCETYGQIIAVYSVLGGLGGALLNAPAYGVIAHYFSARRGFATGIATTAGGIGGIVFPILLQRLLPSVGFAWSCRVLGFIMLGLAVPTNLFIKTPKHSSRACKRNHRAKIAEEGGDDDSDEKSPREGNDDSKKKAMAKKTHRLRLPRFSASVLPDLTVFRDPAFLLSSVGIFFMEWGLFVPITFIVSFAAAHGQEATEAYTLLALLNAGSVFGRFLPGLLADRIGRFNVIVLTIALCVATVLGLWLPAGLVGAENAAAGKGLVMAFAVLFGFASGSNLGLVPVCLGQLCDARNFGRFFSTAMMVASFGTLSSVPIGGALLGLGGGDGGHGAGNEKGWMALILFSGTAYTLALACYAGARVMAVGWGWRKVF